MKSGLLALPAAILLTVPLPLSAAPSDVNAQRFYTEAVAVEGKGMAAMFDKRTKPLLAQLKDAGARAKAANDAATARGAPLYCVPEATRKKGFGPKGVLAMLGRLPESDRRSLSLAEAWQRALVQSYPCR